MNIHTAVWSYRNTTYSKGDRLICNKPVNESKCKLAFWHSGTCEPKR